MPLQTSMERWLGKCAAAAIRRERPFVIAITGSVGKSTTKQVISALLNADGPN